MTELSVHNLRIALCKNSLYGPISGADETLVTYGCELHRMGYDVTVVLLYSPLPGDVFYQRLRQAGVPIVFIATRSRLFDLLRWMHRLVSVHRRLPKPFSAAVNVPHTIGDSPVSGKRSLALVRSIIRKLGLRHVARCGRHFETAGYSLAHVITPDSGAEVMIRAATASGLPVLYHEMGTPYHMPELNGAYQRLAQVTPLCARLAALSPILAEQWASYLPHHSQIMVQPLIVSTPRQWSIPRRCTGATALVGYSARLEIGKGPQILLEAFAKVLKSGRTAHLRIAGAGELSSALKLQARTRGIADQCEFAGVFNSREGCSAFLNTLDIFVLPSFAEGTPNCVIEAMACGVPVVAFDVGGIRDLIAPDAGILVTPGDAAALARAICRLIDDPSLRREMGDEGRRRYETTYAPEAGLPRLLATYSAVYSAADREQPLLECH